MSYNLPHEIPLLIAHDDPELLIDYENKTVYYKNRKLAKKRGFQVVCGCGRIVNTSTNYHFDKPSGCFCRSCLSKKAWTIDSYRSPREAHLKEMGKSESNRQRGRKHFEKLWGDPEWKKKTLEKLHTEETWRKQSETVRKKLANDEDFRTSLLQRCSQASWGFHCDYERKDGSFIHLKSRGESRFAKLLDNDNLTWSYESKGFLLEKSGEFYYPDFYISEIDIWVEVKYLLRSADLRKFNLLKEQSSDIKIFAIGHSHINFLEKECESRKLKELVLEMYETSR